MGNPASISIIIPAYNEERFLPRLLASIARAGERYASAGGVIEVIVADNASTDGTGRVAARAGARVVRVDKRVIAAARNGGARAAGGDLLAFVDADTAGIHPGTFQAIDAIMSRPGAVGGVTGVWMERWSLGIAVTYAMMVPWTWITGMDTGVVFCRRRDFQTIGGYDESRRLAEDVVFLLALIRLGRARGERLAHARRVKAIASTRKFDEHGDWHYLTMLPGVLARYLLGGPGGRARVERYWYEPRR